jgi:hypothetical protein
MTKYRLKTISVNCKQFIFKFILLKLIFLFREVPVFSKDKYLNLIDLF